jgi:hypothetical protein
MKLSILMPVYNERTVVERPGLYRAVFSTWGAAPSALWQLRSLIPDR